MHWLILGNNKKRGALNGDYFLPKRQESSERSREVA